MTEVFNFGTPTTADQSDGGQVYTLGCEWESSVDGLVTGGRWRRSTNAPGVLCYMLLYRKSDTTLLASKTFTPGVGDNDILFDTAVSIAPATRYVTAVLTDRYAFSLGGWPFTSGSGGYMTAPSGVNGRLATTTAGNPVYPSTIHGSAANFFIGPLLEPYVLTLTGATTPTGTLSKTLIRSLGGTVAPTATLTRQIEKSLSAAVTPAGTLAKVIQKNLTGSVNPTGALLKLLSRILGGTTTPQGAVTTLHGRPAIWRAGRPEPKWRAGPPVGGG